MKKSLKALVEQIEHGTHAALLDMNQFEWMEKAGLFPDLKHKRSAYMTAGWRFADRTEARIPLEKFDLCTYSYLTLSVFAVNGIGGSFRLQLDSGNGGYGAVLPVTRNGWNDYRLYLPFLHAAGDPDGWGSITGVTLDCVANGQANSSETVLYFDTPFLWEGEAPHLYERMPELKGAAAFSRTGNYAIVDRKRIPCSIDGADAAPFEEMGILWVPLAPVAAVIAHSAVADNRACTLNFTYRRKKYAFAANRRHMNVDGEATELPFLPKEKNGTLFFPLDFVRSFFHWRQVFTDPMGLIILSNRRAVFDSVRDEGTILSLIADMTFERPNADVVLEDLRRRYPNPTRGRLLLSHDAWTQLRKQTKTDDVLGSRLAALKNQYGVGTASFLADPTAKDAQKEALLSGADALVAFSTLFRLTGDKKYAARAEAETEAFATMDAWNDAVLGEISFAMAACYDWCHHVWSESQKALLERGMLRNGIRPGLELYEGKRKMWHSGCAYGAAVNSGMLALSVALSSVYPESARRLLGYAMKNAEANYLTFAPDGGYAESVVAWTKASKSLGLFSAMLQNACGSDYGLSRAPGFLATARFGLLSEGAGGIWNYHSCAPVSADTSSLSVLGSLTESLAAHRTRRQRLEDGKEDVHPFDLIFYRQIPDKETPELPLDAVYRKAGLAMMRSSWEENGLFVGLHGGSNRTLGTDLDAGSVILDWEGERFFSETGNVESLSVLLRRRAEGQNTFVINPPEDEHVPDQNPAAVAAFTEMRSSPDRAYAVVDMTDTNPAIVKAKRGVLLTQKRKLVVIQDEVVLAQEGEYVFHLWTEAEASVNKSGRTLKLKKGDKTLVCRLSGVGAPAKFDLTPYEESGVTHIRVSVKDKDRVRMALVCRILGDGETGNENLYKIIPISRWADGEI